MQRLIQKSPAPIRRQRGLTLIESLIALIVAALGILGIIGVQMRTLADTQTSVRRAQAVRLIEDLSERLKVHPGALAVLTAFPSGWDATPTGPDCHATECSPEDLAKFDLADWKATVKNVLPLGDANIFKAPGDADTDYRLLGVMISWRENESYLSTVDAATTYKDNIDATKVRASDGTLNNGAAGGGATCPTDRTCHLQYISGTNRCAPDYGSGPPPTTTSPRSPEFFCAD